MSKYTEHFMDELKQIAEKLNTNPEKVESIGTIVAWSKFDYDFIKYIICNIKETWVMDKAIQVITDTWNEYLNKHDDICYNISYTEDYSLETGGISRVKRPLMKMPKFLDIERTLNEIKESELNRREVNERYEKGLSQIKNEKKFESDFEHLKDWKDNPNLDYYLSEEHWNYHVNILLYNNLLVFHEKELGAFLNPTYDSFSQPIRDYTQQYGEMFNEAYRLCNIVLSSSVPVTKVAMLAAEAAKVGIKRLYGNSVDQYGNPVSIDKLAPNVTDLIESYHILGMVNAILTFSDVQKDAVNKFLIALSVYNDNGMYFCGSIHCFEQYNETYEALILANMVNGTMLRPGYDNISRDQYLRKNVPWYEHLVSILEKEKQKEKEKEKKTVGIQEQNNNDCIVINGSVKDCTIIMPAATPSTKKTSSKKGGSNSSSTTTAPKPEKQHGVEYPVFSKGYGVTEYHIKALYLYLTRRGWISTQTKEVDFLRLFNGEDNDCEIIWTGQDKLGKNEPKHLGISALYLLFKNMADEKMITTGSQSERVGPILETHFIDIKGHFLTNVSNINKTSKKANDYINKILATMRLRADHTFIQKKLESDLATLIEKEGQEKYNKYEQ